jgi:PhoPQ-activated pathogenicity-related protein
LGGSKRGWTTWLTAAVDARVTALAPVVIDALNMSEQFPHQVESFGTASEKLRPYTDLHLDELLASDAGAALREIIDPYEYRAVITQPKLIVVATNDRFFPVDSANLYWNGLSGPKYLLYLPNNEHGINDYARLIPSLAALHASAGSGPALAALHWEYRWRADGVELCVSAAPSPRSVTVWRASSATRDFRDSSWTSAPSRAAGRGYSADPARPSDGYVAEFAEATFGDADQAYSLSTNVAIVAARADDDVAAKPLGEPGVCARR